MIRERARIATDELAARAVVATYGADAVARTIADADARGIAVSPFLRRAASGTLPGKAVR